tara:strand:- start:1174 stop:2250 length:1077 start_codon:yes stop_codon:yes gene_type:complete
MENPEVVKLTKELCIEEIENGMSIRGLSKKYNKSNGSIRHSLKKWGLQTKNKSFKNGYNVERKIDPISGFQLCTKCNINKPLTEYYERTERSYHHTECKKCCNESSCIRLKNIKNKVKNVVYSLLGKSCNLCGLEGHDAMMEVHHVDMSKKEIQIGNFKNLSKIEDLKNELISSECVLLCACCHSETHGGMHPQLIKNPPSKNIPNEVELNINSKRCNVCSKVYPNDYYHGLCHFCKNCFNERRNLKLQNIKKSCINYLRPIDNACIKCGYNRYIGALDFHHRNPSQKEFGIARNQSRFGDKHKRELDKCDLLCKNCHRLEHYYLDNPDERPDSSLDNEMNGLNIGTDFGVEESKEED